MPKLMEWGIVQQGMSLDIKNYEGSTAVVRDAKTVQFKDKDLSFNDWGQQVTGWSAINIYDWATTAEGRTLSELREQRMKEEPPDAVALTGAAQGGKLVEPKPLDPDQALAPPRAP